MVSAGKTQQSPAVTGTDLLMEDEKKGGDGEDEYDHFALLSIKSGF